jgi:hypothetical protein
VGTKHVSFEINLYQIHLTNHNENSHINRINVFTKYNVLIFNF